MSDRTQFAIGHNSISVPRMTKRAIEAVIATALTAVVAFVILVLNNVLTGRGGLLDGFDVWRSFIRQPASSARCFLRRSSLSRSSPGSAIAATSADRSYWSIIKTAGLAPRR